MSEKDSNFDVVAIRDSTLKELERLIAERRDLDKRITGMRVALNGFNATIRAQRNGYAFDPPPLDPEYEGIRDMGLTDAVRKVLENAPDGMTPKDVRAKLESLEYKQLPTSNPLAALHGIFTRLEKAGEIEPSQPNSKAYRWIPPIERGVGGLIPDFTLLAGANVMVGEFKAPKTADVSPAARDAMNKVVLDAMKKKK